MTYENFVDLLDTIIEDGIYPNNEKWRAITVLMHPESQMTIRPYQEQNRVKLIGDGSGATGFLILEPVAAEYGVSKKWTTTFIDLGEVNGVGFDTKEIPESIENTPAALEYALKSLNSGYEVTKSVMNPQFNKTAYEFANDVTVADIANEIVISIPDVPGVTALVKIYGSEDDATNKNGGLGEYSPSALLALGAGEYYLRADIDSEYLIGSMIVRVSIAEAPVEPVNIVSFTTYVKPSDEDIDWWQDAMQMVIIYPDVDESYDLKIDMVTDPEMDDISNVPFDISITDDEYNEILPSDGFTIAKIPGQPNNILRFTAKAGSESKTCYITISSPLNPEIKTDFTFYCNVDS